MKTKIINEIRYRRFKLMQGYVFLFDPLVMKSLFMLFFQFKHAQHQLKTVYFLFKIQYYQDF